MSMIEISFVIALAFAVFAAWSSMKVYDIYQKTNTYENLSLKKENEHTTSMNFEGRVNSIESVNSILSKTKKIKKDGNKFKLFLSPEAAIIEIKKRGNDLFLVARFDKSLSREEVLSGSVILKSVINKANKIKTVD